MMINITKLDLGYEVRYTSEEEELSRRYFETIEDATAKASEFMESRGIKEEITIN